MGKSWEMMGKGARIIEEKKWLAKSWENGGKIRKWGSRKRVEGMAGKKRIKVAGKIRKGKVAGKIGGKV